MDEHELTLLNETLMGLAQAGHESLTVSLDAFGWSDVLAAEPQAAISSLFEAQGRTGTWSSAFHDVMAADVARFGLEGAVTVVLPRPNSLVAGTSWKATGADVRGILLGPRDDSSMLVVAVKSEDERDFLAAVDPGALNVARRNGLDPGLGVHEVSGQVDKLLVLAEGVEASAWWERSLARGRLALCHQMVAALYVMIEQARLHVSERVQFGRYVGTFQAVRHKLVEAFVAATAAECSTATAWEAEDFSLATVTAKVTTGKAVTLTTAHTQQLLAGIGFTAEHPYHRFMKRTLVLERILGSSVELAPELGRQLIQRDDAPRLLEL
jgi:alkylation response protein AidB-like acyl-CoA dehydrogenase